MPRSKLPAPELARRHRARDQKRREKAPPRTAKQKKQRADQQARRRARVRILPPEDHRVGPTERRLRAQRAFAERPLLPAGLMSTRGLFRGEGCELVGPPGEACYDFDAWLAWSRDPAGWELARRAA